MDNCGNTVSSTIPITIKKQLDRDAIANNNLLMLVGFGVGYSWAACNVQWVK
ncbi:3-oxoacyl-[acyl-carrier-protein] synthase III C-terminal domain-containing protein [Paenibacillus gorillae]|uniref:3-oxoacyl-[acyl-carrier-protein] synthase III C-terminal domain-containing protein n=1 Tax=Paenibacillus gorillae TaxID=1243662 RepID=UPI001EE36374|nr:3-oxoacyl-[acyl-carrier-protein] synthase III C-terminal domain-containing protein [Paenibacillus gorillae]